MTKADLEKYCEQLEMTAEAARWTLNAGRVADAEALLDECLPALTGQFQRRWCPCG